jgi:hypothetical protein
VVKTEKKEKPKKYMTPPVIRMGNNLNQPVVGPDFSAYIHTPAGVPEFKLTSVNHDEVIDWANKTQDSFRKNNKHISLTGLLYYCKQYFAPKMEDKMAYEKMVASLCRVPTYDNFLLNNELQECVNCGQSPAIKLADKV